MTKNRFKSPPPLDRVFYDREPELVARDLLGKLLISRIEGTLCVGRIVETEAYLSREDPACHAHRGKSRKNAAMFGPPGHAYVYSIHAKWCFNAVTEGEHTASAVLIRAVEPLVGQSQMQARRNTEVLFDLTRGPARLCQALAIDREMNGWDLTRGKTLWIAADDWQPDDSTTIIAAPRIGISSAQELLLRFFYAGNRYVSGPRSQHY